MKMTIVSLTLSVLFCVVSCESGGTSSFEDKRDGKKYKAVKIGNQTWMAENLNFDAEGSKCNDDNPANCEKYGRHYDWETAVKACPAGWHLPTKAELEVLIAAVGGKETAGKFLKAKDVWLHPMGRPESGHSLDSYGFAALPGDRMRNERVFGSHGFWWSSSEYTDESSCNLRMVGFRDAADLEEKSKSLGLSVRCLKD